jgi:putative glutamine amidotransferase
VELTLAREADRRGLPVLAICRGAQVLNVARGGTLHQHLPDVIGDAIAHRQDVPAAQPTHDVDIASGSRLRELLGAGRVAVNSFHHQAADRLGAGLRTTAWAPDGTIEGFEQATPDRFVVGVQWHAEAITALPGQQELFRALVEAAARPAARRPAALRAV